jgi:arsenate reductase
VAVAVTLWFNPRCSKCRGADELLQSAGVELTTVHYLGEPPSREEILRVVALLGLDDPRGLMRTGEPLYAELALASAGPDELVDAMATHPSLIERPVVIRGDRAVIARPPELLLALLDAER